MKESFLPAVDWFKRTAGQGRGKMKCRGNMAEYALPAVLVGLIVVGSAAALLNNGNFARNGAVTQFQAAATGQAGQLALRQLGNNPLFQALSFETERGTRIRLSSFPTDVGASVETSGGSGTTDQLAASIEELVNALVASGEITEAEGNLIKGLSNKGHDLARSQRVLEQISEHCGTSTQCQADIRFNTNHPLYPAVASLGLFSMRESEGGPDDLSLAKNLSNGAFALFGEYTDLANKDDVLKVVHSQSNLKVGRAVSDFLEQAAAVKAEVPLSPKVGQVLDYLSGAILRTSIASALSFQVTSHPANDSAITENPQFAKIQGFSPASAARVTAELVSAEEPKFRSQANITRSNQICDIGQGQSQNGKCI